MMRKIWAVCMLIGLALGVYLHLQAGEPRRKRPQEERDPQRERERDMKREHDREREQEGREEEDDGELDAIMGKRTSFHFANTPFQNVLEKLRVQSGLNIVVHQEVYARRKAEPVTLQLKDVTLWNVFHILARSMDLQFDMMDRTVYLGPQQGGKKAVGRLRIPMRRGMLELELTAEELPPNLRREMVERFMEDLKRDEPMPPPFGPPGERGDGPEMPGQRPERREERDNRDREMF